MTRLLITTALENTWENDKNLHFTFLGEWCKKYSRKHKWERLKSDVITYHWDDRIKLKKDHDYLFKVYEYAIEIIGQKLNEIHDTSENNKHWRIILGPWLISYLPIIFDRWETLRIAMDRYNEPYSTIRLKFNKNLLIPENYNQFVNFFQTDLWNYNIYLRILEFKYIDKVSFIEKDLDIEVEKELNLSDNKAQSFKFRLLVSFEKLINILNKKQSFIFYHSYFSFKRLILLNLKLFQIPRRYSKTFNLKISKEKINLNFREISLSHRNDDDFETFFFSNIMKDIPLAYLESYEYINTFSNKISLNPSTIITANAHWGDEAFKFWISKKIKEGKKLIICQHGGSLPPLFDTFQHDEAISDLYVTWFKPFHSKHRQLTPNKINNQKESSKKKYCVVIGLESTRYSHRATAYAIGNQTIQFVEHSIKFYKNLNAKVQFLFKLKPYFNMGIGTSQMYENALGKDKLFLDISFYKVINKSKLIVCTYPNTTFSEAMASGVPTILLYIPKYFETVPEADELINILKKANIVFNDPDKAAAHVNMIWDDVDAWWNDENVIKAKKIFFETAYNIKRNWLTEWKSFLHNPQ